MIDAFCTEWGKTAVYKTATDAWLDYQFLPLGQSIILNSAMRFLNMLQQKRLIQCCDNGDEEVRFYSADVLGAADVTIPVKEDWSIFTTKTRRRQYIWRDENETVHTDGTATDPLHNLGYLESTDSPPARNIQTFQARASLRPDLRIQDGDEVTFTFDGGTKTITFFAQVTEIWDAHSAQLPKWRMIIEANPIYHATEGGALPSTIERVSNYTPVNTSRFDGFLSDTDNNLQAALDTIDQHLKAGTWTPTLTTVTNLSAATAYLCMYQRIGNNVLVAGLLDVDPVAAGAANLRMSIPIPSNFTATTDASGVLHPSAANEAGSINANVANDALDITLQAISVANHTLYFMALYAIL